MKLWKSIAALAAGAAVLTVSVAAFAADTIKIGDINSYKRAAAFSVPYKQGLDLALEEINAKGGVMGKQIEVISRDDQAKPGEAVKIAEELFSRDGVVMITGSFLSNIGLALSSYAGEKKHLYLAAEPLADSIVWEKGNRYTFRLRPSTSMQSAMLAEAAAAKPAKRWATIAPNYSYGKEAVTAFEKALKAAKPDVEFVASQWPALFKIDAGAEVQALEAAKPDAIFNVTFGSDLAKFVREGETRGLFSGKLVVGLLTGEPEYLDPLKGEAPQGLDRHRLSLVRDHRSGPQGLRRSLPEEVERGSAHRLAGRLRHHDVDRCCPRQGRLHRHRGPGQCLRRARGRYPRRQDHLPQDRPPVHHGRLGRHHRPEGRQGRHGRLEIRRRRQLPAVGCRSEGHAAAVTACSEAETT